MEQKHQAYLEDLAVREGEGRSRGFDLDFEFGEGTKRKTLAYQKRASAERILTGEWAALYDIWARSLFDDEGLLRGGEEEREVLRSVVEKGPLDTIASSRWVAGYFLETGKIPKGREGYEEMLETFLREELGKEVSKTIASMPEYAAAYRICSGKTFWSAEQRDKLVTILINRFKRNLGQESGSGTQPNLLEEAFSLRVLRAYDVKVIPGKRLQITDDPPEEFESTKRPLPEQRHF